MTEAEAAIRLAERISPLLAGHPSERQGAALADLLATWLAGHYVEGDLTETLRIRARLLSEQLRAVELLINVNAAQLGTPHGRIERPGRA